MEAIDLALHLARPGDLLVVLGDDITRSWKQIIRYKPHAGDGQADEEPEIESAPETPAAERLPEGETFRLHEGQTIVKDHRGVRLVTAEHDEEAD